MSERSDRLASDLKVDTLTGPARVLAEEAVRIVERLDNLDAGLRGDPDAWVSLVERMPDTVAEVVVDKALSEVRQQGMALATVLKALTYLGVQEAGNPALDVADEVRRRREEKRRAAGGAL